MLEPERRRGEFSTSCDPSESPRSLARSSNPLTRGYLVRIRRGGVYLWRQRCAPLRAVSTGVGSGAHTAAILHSPIHLVRKKRRKSQTPSAAQSREHQMTSTATSTIDTIRAHWHQMVDVEVYVSHNCSSSYHKPAFPVPIPRIVGDQLQ